MTHRSDFLGLTTDEWQAIGSIATAGAFIIAALAVLVALLQLRHARRAAEAQLAQDRVTAAEQLRHGREAAEQQLEQNRRAAAEQLALDRQAMDQQLEQARQFALDQSRPYVLMTVEPSPISFSFLDLVLENAGSGPAFDVEIHVEPPLRRAREEEGYELANAKLFREPVPMLPPKYRLRTYFDSAIDRNESEEPLPGVHEVTIAYHDGRGNRWQERSVLDITIVEGLLFTEEYGLHHVAKTLKEIRDLMKKSKTLESPLAVMVEDRSEYIARIRAERDERRRQHEAMTNRKAQHSSAEAESSRDE